VLAVTVAVLEVVGAATAAAVTVAVVAVAVVAAVARLGSEFCVGAYGPAGTAHFWVTFGANNPGKP
jgi:hypothetical protein